MARESLRKLKRTGTVREYVKESSSLMLDIHHMSEEDKLFNFILGQLLLVHVEIRRQGAKDLLDFLSLSTWFLGLHEPFLSLDLLPSSFFFLFDEEEVLVLKLGISTGKG